MAVSLTFDHNHYVPVLRPKAGEMSALCRLLDDDARFVTPLIEFFPEMQKLRGQRDTYATADSRSYFVDFACRIGECWDRNPFFFDLEMVEQEFSPLDDNGVLSFFHEAERLGLKAIPVVGLSRSRVYFEAVRTIARTSTHQVCVRLLEADITSPHLKDQLLNLLRRLGLSPANVHLVVDLKLVHSGTPRIYEICENLPLLLDWRTFTVTSGAFPIDLTKWKKNGQYAHPREDYRRWWEYASSSRRRPRLPTYGDYTVQHPFFRKLPGKPNVSASIRYASDFHWVIMRGEALSTSGGTGAQQYLGHSLLLLEREEYSGNQYSYADQFIHKKTEEMCRPGGPRQWIEVGVNRHMTHTTRQILGLFADVAVSRRSRTLPAYWPSKRVNLENARYQDFLFPFED